MILNKILQKAIIILSDISLFLDRKYLQKENIDGQRLATEIRDKIIAEKLGFTANQEKHGWDAYNSNGSNLEVKDISTSDKPNQYNGTFNDISLKRGEEFKCNNNYLTLAVWGQLYHLNWFIIAPTANIGEVLCEKIIEQNQLMAEHKRKRCNPKFTMKECIEKYGFQIVRGGEDDSYIRDEMKRMNIKDADTVKIHSIREIKEKYNL